MIDVKNLHKSFGNHEVLKGVNEHIEKGEKVVVIGPSGSGKSTFLRCLNLLEEPTGGEIIFEGQNITDQGHGYQSGAPPYGHGVPAVQPVPAPDRAREYHAGAGQAQGHDRMKQADKRALELLSACRSAGQGGQLIRRSFPAVSSSVSPSRVRWQ